MGKYKLIKSLAVFALLMVSSSIFAAEQIDKIIAIVNDDIITNYELDTKRKILVARIKDKSKLPPKDILNRQILNKLIADKLQLQLADKYQIAVSDQKINNAVKNIASAEKLNLKEFKQYLSSNNVPYNLFRSHVKDELVMGELQQREVGMSTSVSDSEVDGFINSPLGQDLTGTEYLLNHILVGIPDNISGDRIGHAKSKAQNIVSRAKKGEDFQKLAMAESDGANALDGGSLGWRTIGQIPTLFSKSVGSMQVGDIIGPIKTAGGFHIVQLAEKRVGKEKLHQEIRARQILIHPSESLSVAEANTKIHKLYKEIKAGASFAKLAQENSMELSSAAKGGDLGWVSKDNVFIDFYYQIENLKVNEINAPFKTKLGWHLVQVLGKRSNSTSLSAARNRARMILHERKYNEKLDLWLKRLRVNAKVKDMLAADVN